MDTTTFDTRDEDPWDEYDDGPVEEPLPVRPRRRFLNATTAFLIAAITAAGGFYAGVRVEKNQTTSSTAGGGGTAGASAFASRLRSLIGGAGGSSSAGGASSTGGAKGAGGSSSANPSGGASGGFAGGGGLAGAGAFAARLGGGATGTVSSIKGNTIYLSEASGNTVKVQLNSATAVKKTQSVSRHAVRPGDTVIAAGVTKSNGTIAATSVTDSGNNSTTAPGSGSGGGGGGGGLASLFSAGG